MSARYWRIGRLPSRQSIKQASKEMLFDERQGDFMAFHPDDDGAGPSGLSHHQSLQKESLYFNEFHFDEGSILMSVPILIRVFHFDEGSICMSVPILIRVFHFDEYSILMRVPF